MNVNNALGKYFLCLDDTNWREKKLPFNYLGSYIFLSKKNFHEITTSNQETVATTPNSVLNLPRCGISLIKSKNEFIESMTSLTELNIRENNLEIISENEFGGEEFQQLKKFDLSECQINKMYQLSFNGLKNLTSLILNGNKISRLGKNVFDGLKSLVSLSLAKNNIQILDEG